MVSAAFLPSIACAQCRSRVTGVLAVGFISLMTLVFSLGITHIRGRKPTMAGDRARTASQRRALGEVTLPPLPHLQPPHPKSAEQGTAESNVWGAAPAAPPGPATPMAYRPQGGDRAHRSSARPTPHWAGVFRQRMTRIAKRAPRRAPHHLTLVALMDRQPSRRATETSTMGVWEDFSGPPRLLQRSHAFFPLSVCSSREAGRLIARSRPRSIRVCRDS